MSEIQWSDAEREAAYEASPLLMTRVAKAAVDASIDALAPFVAERERQAAARAYDDGYNDAVTMARCYGHTDHWPESDEPRNPYRADPATTEEPR